MASLSASTVTAAGTTTKTYSSSFTTTSPTVTSWPLYSKTSKICALKSLKHKVSCNAGSSDNLLNSLDRRNLLLGLGGLAGAVNLPSAVAAPLAAPDISKCGTNPLSGFVAGDSTPTGGDCCPPDSSEILDFKFPTNQTFKMRPAAHLLSPKYIAKFNEAIKRMKELPEDDPRNFMQQARIHCAYCNGAYTQSSSGFPDIEIQIHNSWLFFPFHRWYLYFYERILGSLIDDPTFALPFWNWDTPAGMTIPAFFNDPKSALFDTKRNQAHLTSVVDLGFNGTEANTTDIEKVTNNLAIMYRQMVTNSTDPLAFFGGVYRAGKQKPASEGGERTGAGSIETSPHVAVHRWVGDTPREKNGENMGNFYSAGRDTLFYCHHSNVDRMWSLWKMLGQKKMSGENHKDITDPDWLNTSFVFYDENKNLVRVYVKDCLLTNQLGYDYQRVDIPWLQNKPVPRAPRSGIAKKLTGKVKNTEDLTFPVKLDKTLKVLVSRPKKSRSKKEKEDKEELLIIEGITYDSEKYVKFDVFVNEENDDADAYAPNQTEFVGSFAQLPHKHKGKSSSKTNFRAGLTELLEDLEADDDESVLVTVVPKSGTDDVTIDAIKITYA